MGWDWPLRGRLVAQVYHLMSAPAPNPRGVDTTSHPIRHMPQMKKAPSGGFLRHMADGVGFEPTIRF